MAERYKLGQTLINKLNPEASEKLSSGLSGICPDMEKYIIEFAYGDILQRPDLDIQTRELITIGILTAMGNSERQLKNHIEGALNLGCPPKKIVEVILQTVLYAGFPAAMNGMALVNEIFKVRNIS